MTGRGIAVLGAASVALALGCSVLRARPDPVRYFVLTPAAAPDGGATAATGPGGRPLALGLGPIRLPPYLGRLPIVVRLASNQLQVSPFDRWAEPLAQNFSRVLAEDLGALLATDGIVTHPWYPSTPLDYQVGIEVTRFEQVAGGDAELAARWEIADGGGAVLLTRTSHLTERPGGEDTEAMVAALSRAVAALSNDIATAVRQVAARR